MKRSKNSLYLMLGLSALLLSFQNCSRTTSSSGVDSVNARPQTYATTVANCVPATQTSPGTYTQVNQILTQNTNVQQNCINCHNAGQNAPDLSSYEALTVPGVGAQIVMAINMTSVTITASGSWQPMPPETSALTAAQIQTITSWVNACMPND